MFSINLFHKCVRNYIEIYMDENEWLDRIDRGLKTSAPKSVLIELTVISDMRTDSEEIALRGVTGAILRA